ncbi:MAG: alpha-galactosidase, partial [Phycisphaerales bacterium]|nr:alpha-galactosidase [Phycisphaerales bacterium]
KKVLPSYGQAARPIDLFENPLAELFALPVHTAWGDWTVVANFNAKEAASQRKLDFARVGLDAKKHYLVYDFWSQQLIGGDGDESGGYATSVAPTSVNLVAIREKTGAPQLLGTDRHVIQGAVELADVRWDAATQSLTGVALGAPGMKWRLAVYVPNGYRFDQKDSRAASNLSEISVDAHVLRAGVQFADAVERVQWSLRFEKP